MNAIITPLFDEARAQIARGDVGDGPFRGVPLVLKDLGATLAGTPQYCGTRVLRDRQWISPADSELTKRFRRAGFVFCAKTNTPELGLSPTTEPDTFGASRNPWNTERITGGSSGGSAAAVASRMVAIAHAGDGGGSIRNPAGACGIAGLKPSRGRVTLGPSIGWSWSGCTTELVVARSVRDIAKVLDAVAGYLPGDPSPAPPPLRPFAAEVGAPVEQLRIGFFVGNADTPGSPDAQAAVELCMRTLESLGHHVVDAHPADLDRNELGDLLFTSVAASVAHELEQFAAWTGSPVPPDGVEPATWHFAEMGRSLTATQFLANVDALHTFSRHVCAWWDDFDILVTPTMSEAAPPVGELRGAQRRTHRAARAVHRALQRHRSTRVRVADALDRRRVARGHPTRGTLRRRGRAGPARRADRSRAPLDPPTPTGLRVARATGGPTITASRQAERGRSRTPQ